ncbi:MAG: gliding motility-associated C-terminal domain-containing protein [Cyclobacteriaceae bacterium]|nr:gliding motility-associated C-terminal domain-containing protein [Cyclobacteriaceae bacterium]
MRGKFVSAWFMLFMLLFSNYTDAAPPANDNCENAMRIPITMEGFQTGIFTSERVNMREATVQNNEFFHPALAGNGLNRRSVWYKFTLPTARQVAVTLREPVGSNVLSQNQVGFTVYRAENCFPDLKAAEDSKITPLASLGQSRNSCLSPGEYLIQVASVQGIGFIDKEPEILLELQVERPGTLPEYDRPFEAYNFGPLTDWAAGQMEKTVNYNIGCQTIEGNFETDCLPASERSLYTQSAWHTFSTGDHVSTVSVQVASSLQNSAGIMFFRKNPFKAYVQFYEGDVTSALPANLQKVGACIPLEFDLADNVLENERFKLQAAFMPDCEIKPNTTYSFTLLFPNDSEEDIKVVLRSRGFGLTKSPGLSGTLFSPASDLGVLPLTNNGASVKLDDYFACNGQIDNENACANLHGPGGINFTISDQQVNYSLNTWFTFELSEQANVGIRYTTPANAIYPVSELHPLHFRVYEGDPSAGCTGLTNNNLKESFTIASTTEGRASCLPAGKYLVQVFAAASGKSGYDDKMYGWFGRRVNFDVRGYKLLNQSNFNLLDAGSYERIGNFPAVLQTNVGNISAQDFFSCIDTPVPADLLCKSEGVAGQHTKAMYRIFSAPANQQGLLEVVSTISRNVPANNQISLRLFQGNADNLAIAGAQLFPGGSIEGLIPVSDCYLQSQMEMTLGTCLSNGGDFTLVTGGNSGHTDLGQISKITYRPLDAKFDARNRAENLGNITLSQAISSDTDVFTCTNNGINLPGICSDASETKMIFREFEVSEPTRISILSLQNGVRGGDFGLFEGRASIATENLRPFNDFIFEEMGCVRLDSVVTSDCSLLQPGWYTIVSYGTGISFEDNDRRIQDTGKENQIIIAAVEPIEPRFNRPHKAYFDGVKDWVEQTTADGYPVTETRYQLEPELFSCIDDLPFEGHPIPACSEELNRTAYYVFEITKPSNVRISGLTEVMHAVVVYDFDVREDSSLMVSRPPLQPCYSGKGLLFTNNSAELCSLEPGFYTIVIFATEQALQKELAPVLIVESTGTSRFDHAAQAYDFGLIPPDGLLYYGKPGDQHPDNPAWVPSTDIIYCTTGAQESDPPEICNTTEYNARLYQENQHALFAGLGVSSVPVRRNLWYTFVLEEHGNVNVQVRLHGAELKPGNQNTFSVRVFSSDEDGTIDFENLRVEGKIDSTLNSGLREVARASCNTGGTVQNLSFSKADCGDKKPTRYYILVDSHFAAVASNMYPNLIVDVGISYEEIETEDISFDHFTNANVIGSTVSAGPDYALEPLSNGEYRGYPGSFICATRAQTDQNPCGEKTIWYTFTLVNSGTLNYIIESNGNLVGFDARDIILYKQIIPGDSSSNGLIPAGSLSTVRINSLNWGQSCVEPGRYYIMLTGCNAAPLDFQNPVIVYNQTNGDGCGSPSTFNLFENETATATANIACNTFGGSFGENGSNLGCLFGPENYKSAWFKVVFDASVNMDLDFDLRNNTNARNDEIRYRVLYGACDFMTAGPCNTDALSAFTLPCMQSGDYFVQVVVPASASGNIGLSVRSRPTAIPDCTPIDPFQPVAAFDYDAFCDNDTIQFVNESSQGDLIQYKWYFGLNDATSEELAPAFVFPSEPDQSVEYMVSLVVSNMVNDNTDSISRLVIVRPKIPDGFLGTDNPVLCSNEASVTVVNPNDYFDILWDTGEATHSIEATEARIYQASLSIGNCSKTDTVRVLSLQMPLPDLGEDITVCENDEVVIGTDIEDVSYRWSTSAETSEIMIEMPGIYTLEIQKSSCIASDSIEIFFNPLPIVELGGDQRICEGNSIVFDAGNDAESYLWQDGSTESTFTAETQGLYSVETRKGNCTRINEVFLEVMDVPEAFNITAPGDGKICAGDWIELKTNVFFDQDYSFEWFRDGLSYSSVRENLRVNRQGVFGLIVTNMCGSTTASNTFEVSVFPVPAIPAAISAERCGPGTLTLEAGGGSRDIFRWYREGDLDRNIAESNDRFFTTTALTNSTAFFVSAFNGHCESDKATAEAIVKAIPELLVPQEQVIVFGESLQLSVSGAMQYEWSPEELVNDPGADFITVRPDQSTVFVVRGIGANGCEAYAEIPVRVLRDIIMPNTITPNNDGLNDEWIIENIDLYPNCVVRIFDRWGNEVFHSRGYPQNWAGTDKNGRALPTDTYFYTILLNDRIEANQLSGHINLVR